MARHRARTMAAPAPPRGRPLWTALALVLLVGLVYAPSSTFDFVKWDDPQYITDNPIVRGGLSWSGLAWAATTAHAPYWHPVTWLSHMLDVQLFGLDAGGHHITNVVFHAANTLLLFAILLQATGATGRSAFVAAIFAAHPLHVESVAWVAERKDVLSAFFSLLTMWAYIRYVRRGGAARYALLVAFFALALMCKPTAVTLPFALLLLDVWPLRRKPSIVDKIPLVAMAIGASLVTVVIQRQVHSLPGFDVYPLRFRLVNALTSYVLYIANTIWPAHLAPLYPFARTSPPVWVPLGALAIVVGLSAAAAFSFRTRPYIFAGWFWFVGILVPVIGLVQSGEQALADRFMYLPIVGLLVIASWGAVDVANRWRLLHRALPWAAAAAVLACAIASADQLPIWRNTLTMWQHTVAVTGPNPRAQSNLALALEEAGRVDEAIDHYRDALRINPAFGDAHVNLGLALAGRGQFDEAIGHYESALRLEPDDADAQNDLGNALAQQGRAADAIPHFRAALRVNPDNAEAHNNLANALAATGRDDEAIQEYEAALRLKADLGAAHYNLAAILAAHGRLDGAREHFEAALRIDPTDAGARDALERLRKGGWGR